MSFNAVRFKELMIANNLTFAVAESLTSGRVQSTVGSASGASMYFRGGITVYTIAQKVKHLHVDREHAQSVNAVSARVAEEMARGVSSLFESDYSVSTTGYAEASPDSGVVDPFAYVAVWKRTPEGGEVVCVEMVKGAGLSRTEMQQHVAEVVLSRAHEHVERGVHSLSIATRR